MAASTAVWATLLIVMAGCIQAGAPEDAVGASDDRPIEALSSATLGGIVGLVTDDTLLPLPNASVILSGSGRDESEVANATTGPDGSFRFAMLEPETYRVSARAGQHFGAAQLVTVRANEVARSNIVADDVPSDAPYRYVVIKSGLVSCAGSYIVSPSSYSCTENENEIVLQYPVPANFALIISETMWDAEDYLAHEFDVSNESTNAGATNAAMALVVGEPPLRMTFRPGEAKPPDNEDAVFASAFVAVPAEAFDMKVRTFYAGILADEINATAYPACSYTFSVRCSGVGFTLGVRFDMFETLFINGAPEDADDYSALPPA